MFECFERQSVKENGNYVDKKVRISSPVPSTWPIIWLLMFPKRNITSQILII